MPRKILAAIDDMFFAAKVRATAEALGRSEIKFYRRLDLLVDAANAGLADLILVDLHNEKIDPIELAVKLKSAGEAKTELLGFFSHVETDLQRKALEAGYDQVIPRSVFSRDLAKILGQ